MLEVAQIRWLSELVFFDFDIKYRTGRSNQAVDAFSCHLKSNEDSSSNVKGEEYEKPQIRKDTWSSSVFWRFDKALQSIDQIWTEHFTQ